ncbi:MAG TPA: hypothetical protein VGI39_24625 [Polyangiaceae bacterium]|jgi:ABC-type phosphate transport system substrate-binding protein
MTPKHTKLALACAAALALFAPLGCDALLGGGGYDVASDAGSSIPDVTTPGADVQSTPDTGPSGVDASDGCATDPQNKPGFEGACTNGTCAPFDNASRNTMCADGGTVCPDLPAPVDAGPPPVVDSGAPEASAGDDGGDEAGPPPPPPDAGPTHPSCFSLSAGPAGGAFPKPVLYATGSTAIQPYVARVSQVLQQIGAGSVVYLGSGSCSGVNAMVNPNQGYKLAQLGATATYYDSVLSSGNVQSGTCAIDDPNKLADLGLSDVFPETCLPQQLSNGLGSLGLNDFHGPVEVMEMVVPTTSSQSSVSTPAAYMIWGFGDQSGVSPWTDETYLFQRSATSGTQNEIASLIGVPAAQWHGSKHSGSSDVLTAIQNVKNGLLPNGAPGGDKANVEKTMGILASDFADANRQDLKPLAVQDMGQSCGWFPDSTQSSFDKKNVRDGHYPIWGPSHLLANVDGQGNPTSGAVDTLIKSMNGANPDVLAQLDIVQFYASSHIIPSCAMHVSRSSDGGDYSPFSPPVPCSCYYDLKATGQTTCASCSNDTDCAGAPGGATSCVKWGIPAVGYCEEPAH